jgi:hypothetical protein
MRPWVATPAAAELVVRAYRCRRRASRRKGPRAPRRGRWAAVDPGDRPLGQVPDSVRGWPCRLSIASRSSSGAVSCSGSRSWRNSKRPEHAGQTPVTGRPSPSRSVPSRGLLPLPTQMPAYGIVTLRSCAVRVQTANGTPALQGSRLGRHETVVDVRRARRWSLAMPATARRPGPEQDFVSGVTWL